MNATRTLTMGVAGLGLLGVTMLQGRAWRAPEAGAHASLADTASAPGTVAAEGRVVAYPGAEVNVGAESWGRVVRVLVEEGQQVRKGDLLAEVESDELEAALAEARARMAEAEAEARLAESNLERRRRLFEEKIVSAQDLDGATRDLDVARARQGTAEATVMRYEAQLRKTRTFAPIAGTVTSRRVDPGQTVETAGHMFTLADLTRLRVEGEAHEADASAIAIGAPVEITADGFPGQSWKGRVEEIPGTMTLRRLKPQDPSRPTDTRVLAVKVAFAQPTPLSLGTTVEIRIEARRDDDRPPSHGARP